MRSRFVAMVVVAVALQPANAVAKAPPQNDSFTLGQLQMWLKAKRMNDRGGLDNEAVDAELRKHRQVPLVRHACRKLFNVSEVTDRTIEQLTDWLCANYDLTETAAEKLTLGEALAKISAKTKDKP